MKNTENLKRDSIITQLSNKIGMRCWYCGTNIQESLHVDHIDPKTKNNGEMLEDFALSCPECNRAKFSKDIVSFLRWLSFIRSNRFSCYMLTKLDSSELKELGDTNWDLLRKF